MKLLRSLLCVACWLLLPGLALAEVKVSGAWIRATVAAQKVTGAFMALASDKAVSLVSAASPAAGMVEIHEMRMQGNIMQMRPVERVEVLPGKVTELKPGGYHIMLMNLAKPLGKGGSVPLMLTFEGADGKKLTVEVQAEVLAPGEDGGHRH
jgi:hypothetical protein